MERNLAEAIKMLEPLTDGQFRFWLIAGPNYARQRTKLMNLLVGHKAKRCGAIALQSEFHIQAGVTGETPYAKQAAFEIFCKLARAFKDVKILT